MVLRLTTLISGWRPLRAAIVIAAVAAVGAPVSATPALAAPSASTDSYHEEEVQVRDGDLTLPGTLEVPAGGGRHPAVAFVHASGLGPRQRYQPLAEAFARAGIAGLVYDKRQPLPVPGVGVSYSDLADDALAAVRLLRQRPEVDPSRVGLWGLSEGGWVAPLAASRSTDVGFLILVGASGVPRAQQGAWSLRNDLGRLGTRGRVVDALVLKAGPMVVSSGLYSEAGYDTVPVLELVHQPVLAIWSSLDPVVPPVESVRVLQAAMERAGNDRYTIRFFPNASHSLRVSPDGFYRAGARFAPGYFDLMTAWVNDLPASAEPEPGARISGPVPVRSQPSPAAVLHVAWYQSAWVQLGVAGFMLSAFGATLAGLLRGRRRPWTGSSPGAPRRPVRGTVWLSSLGLAAILGLLGFFAISLSDFPIVGPLAPGGQPLAWLALQVVALGAAAAGLVFALGLGHRLKSPAGRAVVSRGDFVLALAALLFVIWGLYWDLLLPG